jgi:hypothetical protein
MKKKIGTLLKRELFIEAKQYAAGADKALARVIEEALDRYLSADEERKDALRAVEKFCSHQTCFSLEEINEMIRYGY